MPEPTDIGDAAEVPEDEQLDVDEPEPNEDADASLDDIEDGEVVDVTEDEEA